MDSDFLSPYLASLADDARATGTKASSAVHSYARRAIDTLRSGGKILLCGNGGSASTVEHVAAEYAVRFRRDRRPLAAMALTANSAYLTAAANDFSFEDVFARGVRTHARKGDLLVVHSTSGRSPNLLRAVEQAVSMEVATVGLLGRGGGPLARSVDLPIVVPADDSARVQELHLAIEHAVVGTVEAWFVACEAEEAQS